MTAKEFVKGAIKYYAQSILGLFRALFPKTYHMTFFAPKIGHKQFIRIEKIWMGQLLEEEIYELADTPEKKMYLDEMLKMGEITAEEYEKYLSPLKNKGDRRRLLPEHGKASAFRAGLYFSGMVKNFLFALATWIVNVVVRSGFNDFRFIVFTIWIWNIYDSFNPHNSYPLS